MTKNKQKRTHTKKNKNKIQGTTREYKSQLDAERRNDGKSVNL